MFFFLEAWIAECCLYSSLWRTPTKNSAFPPSLVRLKTLHRALSATTSYIKTILELPKTTLFHLGFQSWAGWFHIVVVTCKLVFLEDNERIGQTNFEGIPQELEKLHPHLPDHEAHNSKDAQPQSNGETTSLNPLSVARQYEVPQLLDRFMGMLRVCQVWSRNESR